MPRRKYVSELRFRDTNTSSALTERLFRLVVDSSPNGVVMVDRRGTIVLVNRETERLFGYSRDELVGQSIEVSGDPLEP